MKKILATAFVFTSLITTAEAAQQADNGFVVGADYSQLTTTVYYEDAHLGAITASVGYKFNFANNFSLIPEYKIGTGIVDDSETTLFATIGTPHGSVLYRGDIDYELDSFMAFSLKVQYELDNGIFFYIAPSYSRAEASMSGTDYQTSTPKKTSFSETYTGLGLLGGLGFNLNKHWGADISYQKYSDIKGGRESFASITITRGYCLLPI